MLNEHALQGVGEVSYLHCSILEKVYFKHTNDYCITYYSLHICIFLSMTTRSWFSPSNIRIFNNYYRSRIPWCGGRGVWIRGFRGRTRRERGRFRGNTEGQNHEDTRYFRWLDTFIIYKNLANIVKGRKMNLISSYQAGQYRKCRISRLMLMNSYTGYWNMANIWAIPDEHLVF